MGDTRGFFACAAALAVVFSLSGCASLDAGGMSNAESAGVTIGASARTATPAPDSSGKSYSVNSGWKDTTGCPAGVFAGFTQGIGATGTAVQTKPSTSSGPASLPTLTEEFVPSCAFVYKTTSGLSLRAEVFIGMGPSYRAKFVAALNSAGYISVPSQTTTYSTAYTLGASVVAVEYVPVNTEGDPYSLVAVLGT